MNNNELLNFVIKNGTNYVSLYRKLNPRSRAVDDWTYYGSSGVVKRATCIYCRRLIATCSAKYPETKSFTRIANEHTKHCKVKWLSELSKNYTGDQV